MCPTSGTDLTPWPPSLQGKGEISPLQYGEGLGEGVRPLIRRQWTSFYPNEERRITLVDLLFAYHPLGGLVMIADLVASYCHEQGKDYAALFGRVATMEQLLDTLIERAPEIEHSLQRYDPRDYSLRETLHLLAGAIR
jgi:hypothetical protein